MVRPEIKVVEDRKALIMLLDQCMEKPSIFAKTFLKMDLFPKNAEYADCKERFIIYRSGRQHGKCVFENEYIYTENGIIKAKDIKNGDKILGGVVVNPYTFKDEIYDIRFWNGTSLKVNAEHPFMTENGWIKASDLTQKHKIEFTSGKSIKGSFSLGEKTSKLFGYLYSDGYFGKNQSVKFTNNNRSFLNEVAELASSSFIIEVKEQSKEKGIDMRFVVKGGGRWIHNPLMEFIRENNLMQDDFGKIQDLVHDDMISFIQGYFNGDGYLWVKDRVDRKARIEVGFSIGISEKRAYQFQFMLWKLGINSTVKKEWHTHSTVPFYRVLVARHEEIQKIIPILDHSKYPEKFRKAISLINTKHSKKYPQHIVNSNTSQFVRVRKITKLGKDNVIGFTVEPSHEIYSYLGMRTHNTTSTAVKAIHFAFFAPTMHERVIDVCDIVIVAPTRDQANIMLDRIKTLIHRSEFLVKHVFKETMGEVHIKWLNGRGISRIYTRAAGEKGTSIRGYCIQEDEYIYTNKGTKLIKTIKEGDEILGGKVKGVHIFEDDLYEVRLFNGTKLKVNGDHPFMTKRGWIKATDLQKTDKIEFIKSSIKHTKSIGKNMAKLMGYMHSDGYTDFKHVEFYNTNKLLTNEVKYLVDEQFSLGCNEYKNGERLCFTQKSYTKTKNPLISYLKNNNLMGSDLGLLTELPEDELKEFVNGLFNGDGSLCSYTYTQKNKIYNKIELSFAMGIHKKRAIDLQFILWRLGIDSFIKHHSKRNCWYVKTTDKLNLLKILEFLDTKKYPEKFKIIKELINDLKEPKGNYHGRFVSLRYVKPIGKGNVVGFEVNPTHEIITYLGMRTHNTPHIIIADECSFLPEQVLVSLMPAGMASKVKVWLTSTPYTPTGYFYNAHMNSRPRNPTGQWIEFHARSTDSPLIQADPTYVEQQKKQLTEAQYRMEVDGEFLEVGDSFIPRHLIEESMISPTDPPILIRFYLGVDVARQGEDETAISVIGIDTQEKANLVELYTERRSNLVDLAGVIQKFIEKYNVVTAYIDESAVGAGLIDICNSRRMRVRGIVMSLEEQERLYKNLLMLFENRRIYLHGNHKMAGQLTYLKTKWTEGNKMRIVSEMPDDCADSLTLACKALDSGGRMFILSPAKHLTG